MELKFSERSVSLARPSTGLTLVVFYKLKPLVYFKFVVLENFDWNFNPSINRQQMLRLASCDYISQHANVLIVGPTGAGKSHLAQALVHQACRQGFDVVFINTQKMLQHLAGSRADHSLERRMALYTRPALLV